MTDAERTALYRLYDVEDRLLYVGISCNPEGRFKAHRKEKAWWPQVDGISIEWLESRYKASLAETQAIATEGPLHNIHQTESWKAQQRADALAVSPQARRNRSVGLRARAIQVRTLAELTAQGIPEVEAKERAQLAREEYVEDHRPQ